MQQYDTARLFFSRVFHMLQAASGQHRTLSMAIQFCTDVCKFFLAIAFLLTAAHILHCV